MAKPWPYQETLDRINHYRNYTGLMSPYFDVAKAMKTLEKRGWRYVPEQSWAGSHTDRTNMVITDPVTNIEVHLGPNEVAQVAIAFTDGNDATSEGIIMMTSSRLMGAGAVVYQQVNNHTGEVIERLIFDGIEIRNGLNWSDTSEQAAAEGGGSLAGVGDNPSPSAVDDDDHRDEDCRDCVTSEDIPCINDYLSGQASNDSYFAVGAGTSLAAGFVNPLAGFATFAITAIATRQLNQVNYRRKQLCQYNIGLKCKTKCD